MVSDIVRKGTKDADGRRNLHEVRLLLEATPRLGFRTIATIDPF